jgi:hypothetical protein
LLEEVGCWWGGGYCYADGIFEFGGFFGGAEERVYCGGGVEVGYVFFFEEFPD